MVESVNCCLHCGLPQIEGCEDGLLDGNKCPNLRKRERKITAENDNKSYEVLSPMPKRFRDSRFDSAAWAKNKDERRAVEELYASLVGLLKEVEEKSGQEGPIVVIKGQAGAGKTWACCALVLEARKRNLTSFYIRAIDFCQTLREEWTDGADASGKRQTARALMDGAKNCDLLVIDDLGQQRDTPVSVEAIMDIIDWRWSELKATVLATNYSAAELKRRGTTWQAIADRMNDAEIYKLEVQSLRGRNK